LKKEEQIIKRRLERMNKNRKTVKYSRGDKVMVFTRGTKGKLQCLWSDQAIVETRVNTNSYTVRYPNGSKKTVSAQRLRLSEVTHRDNNEILGPFSHEYPNFIEGQSAGKAPELGLELLDSELIKPIRNKTKQSYRKIDKHDQEIEDNEEFELTEGQFVAYKDVSGGWKIAQYLGDKPDTPDNKVRLRAMNALITSALDNPRETVWRYEWKAQRGRNVVAKQGKGPSDKPAAKNTGSLKELWVDVNKSDIYCTVELTGGNITSTAWRELSNYVNAIAIASIHILYLA